MCDTSRCDCTNLVFPCVWRCWVCGNINKAIKVYFIPTLLTRDTLLSPSYCQMPAKLTEIYKDILTEGPSTREATYGKGKPHSLKSNSCPSHNHSSYKNLFPPPNAPNSAKSENSTSVFFHTGKSCYITLISAVL